MDTSKEYIKMCEKATEIQKSWSAYYGDVCYSEKDTNFDFLNDNKESNIFYVNDGDGCLAISGRYELPKDYKERYIWLPRQDQLIEMIEYPYGIGRIIIELSTVITEHPDLILYGGTLEQIYLLYLMRKKHQKRWNGEEWEAI